MAGTFSFSESDPVSYGSCSSTNLRKMKMNKIKQYFLMQKKHYLLMTGLVGGMNVLEKSDCLGFSRESLDR